jgi:hypothetical protein
MKIHVNIIDISKKDQNLDSKIKRKNYDPLIKIMCKAAKYIRMYHKINQDILKEFKAETIIDKNF